MRFEHLEQRRKEKFNILVQERQVIIEEEVRGVWAPGQSIINHQLSKHSSGGSGMKGTSMALKSKLSAPLDSAMIEKERQTLEKIKLKQQKEMEQMMEHEKQLQEIRDRNEQKLFIEREREERRQQDLYLKQKEQEARKLQEEERKRQISEKEAEEGRHKQQEQYRKEQEKAEQQRVMDLQRQKEMKQRDEDNKRKQIEFQQQTEMILRQQQLEVEKRKQEMDRKDHERREFLSQQQKFKAQESEQKRIEKERKISQVRQKEEEILKLQRKQFMEKERQAEEQRRQFELRREHERLENERLAHEKQLQIEEVKAQNELLEEQRKQEFLRNQRIAEERKRQLEERAELDRKEKRKQEMEKNKYREDVLHNMLSIEDQRKKQILDKRQEVDYKVQVTQQMRGEDLRYRKELENLKRNDRKETVERIQKIQQYQREKVMEKIISDDVRSMQLKQEKEALLIARGQMRKTADLQKQNMLNVFEKMKLKGKLDKNELSKIGADAGSSFQNGGAGISSPQPVYKALNYDKLQASSSTKHINQQEQGFRIGRAKTQKRKTANNSRLNKADAQRKIENLRQRHNQELLNILEEEQRAEADREAKLKEIVDENERKRLEKIFGIERAKASERIVYASSEHERMLNREMQKLGLL